MRSLAMLGSGLGAMLVLTGCGANETNPSPLPAEEAPSEEAATQPQRSGFDLAVLEGRNVLVFSKTGGWRHDSIETGWEMFRELSAAHDFDITISEDSSLFTDAQLSDFDAIVFLNTTGDILDDEQQAAMERFIRSGGGFVGIHSATDTEMEAWDWYNRLAGAAFDGHPNEPSNVQEASLAVVDAVHPATSELPPAFQYTDEWYDFARVNTETTTLLTIDRQSYIGAKGQGLEPISWFHEFDGGRVFYTNLGHSSETFLDPLFQTHLLGGMIYAVGE